MRGRLGSAQGEESAAASTAASSWSVSVLLLVTGTALMLSEVVTYWDGVVSKGDRDVNVARRVDVNWKTVASIFRDGHYLRTAITHSTL